MDPITLKGLSAVLGGAVSAFITWLFNLSPEAMLAGFLGSLIGEMLQGKDTYWKTFTTVCVTTVIVAFAGSLIVSYFKTYPPTGLLGVTGFVVAYYRNTILNRISTLISSFSISKNGDGNG